MACDYDITATDNGECYYAQDGYDCDGNAQTLAYNSLVYREDFSDGSAQNWNTSNGASGSQSVTYQDNYSYWNMT